MKLRMWLLCVASCAQSSHRSSQNVRWIWPEKRRFFASNITVLSVCLALFHRCQCFADSSFVVNFFRLFFFWEGNVDSFFFHLFLQYIDSFFIQAFVSFIINFSMSMFAQGPLTSSILRLLLVCMQLNSFVRLFTIYLG